MRAYQNGKDQVPGKVFHNEVLEPTPCTRVFLEKDHCRHIVTKTIGEAKHPVMLRLDPYEQRPAIYLFRGPEDGVLLGHKELEAGDHELTERNRHHN